MKKLILLLILILVAVVIGSPGYENPQTYTEVDPSTDLSLYGDPTYRVWVDDIASEVVCYVKKDFGAGYFTDFEMNVDTELHTTASSTASLVWAVSVSNNTRQDMYDNDDGIIIQWRDATGIDPHFRIASYVSDENDDTGKLSLNQFYYLRINRTGSLTWCKVYSDASHETLVDSIGVDNDNTAYQQLFYALSTGSTTLSMDSYNEKLEIISAGGSAAARNVIVIQ